MLILPAIDILEGKVVRLFQGDYQKQTAYHTNPLAVAQSFAARGYRFLHLIDLGGAKTGSPQALKEIQAILSLGVSVQVGGGIRSFAQALEYLSMGVKRIIIGTAAITNLELIESLLQTFPSDALIVSLDVRKGKVAIQGWTEDCALTIEEAIERLPGVEQIIVTDIERDGTLKGVDGSFYQSLVKRFPNRKFYAAGGIANEQDIETLRQAGVTGAIVGKAFYEGMDDCKS